MDSKKISIINKNAIQSKHKCEHEPYEYYKYEVTGLSFKEWQNNWKYKYGN